MIFIRTIIILSSQQTQKKVYIIISVLRDCNNFEFQLATTLHLIQWPIVLTFLFSNIFVLDFIASSVVGPRPVQYYWLHLSTSSLSSLNMFLYSFSHFNNICILSWNEKLVRYDSALKCTCYTDKNEGFWFDKSIHHASYIPYQEYDVIVMMKKKELKRKNCSVL